ncbi:MAG: mechanosensitive ion channel domain-containing protein [Chthoniobacterales bacterium]
MARSNVRLQRFSTPPHRQLLFVGLCIVVFGINRGVEAQVGPRSPTAAESVTPAPKATPAPVPLADTIAAAESTSEKLQEMESNLSAAETSDVVAEELPRTSHEIAALLDETTRSLKPGTQLETLGDLGARWKKLNEQLAVWARDLTTRANVIEKEIDSLPDYQAIWTQTLEVARSSSAPPEVTERIDSLLAAIARIGSVLQTRRAKLLTLQSRVAEQTQRVTAAQRLIKLAKSEAVERLGVRDSRPIWSAEVRAAAAHDLVDETQGSLSTQFAQLRAYLAREWAKLIYLALFFCGFAFLLFRIKRQAARWTGDDAALERANRVLQLPIATAGVLAFLVARPLFQQAPRLFWAALAAVALIPIVILLRRLLDRHLSPILNALVIFYIVAQLRKLAATLPVLSRVLLLVEMAGGAIFLLWFIRSTRSVADGGVANKMTRASARIGLVLFAAVFVVNSLGYVRLANYLGGGALAAAYLAILLYAAAGILEGLAHFALQIRPLASLGAVRDHRPLLRARIARLIYLAAFIIWLLLTLDASSLRAPIVEKVSRFVTAEISVGSLHLSLGALLAFSICIWLAILLSRFIRFILEGDIYDRLHVARGPAFAVSTILHYVILLFGFFAALAAVGADLTKFAILAGAFGVGIGFGLQHIFNNFVSGLILLFERPVQVGDVIEVSGSTGTVQRIGIRASIIRLADSSELIVPNGQLISEKVGNWTLSNRQRRLGLEVGVAYGTEPTRVIDLLTRTAAGHPLVATRPAPEAYMDGFGADALVFKLFFSVDDFDQSPRIKSDVAVAVNASLAEAKIPIPYPQRDLHLQSIEPLVTAALQKGESAPPDGSGR